MNQTLKCRYFLSPQGCRRGDQCHFEHIQEGLVNTSNKGCKHGSSCKFKHIKSQETISDQPNPNFEPVLTRHLNGPFFSIDVECVATGLRNSDRAVARIAVVNEHEEVVFDQFVRPVVPIVSCLTSLTGILPKDLQEADCLEIVIDRLRHILPTNCIIVGQSIEKDLQWTRLEKGRDYREAFDIAQLFRVPAPPNAKFQYRQFSLKHVVKNLLDEIIQEANHDPIIDAKYSMRVFHKFRYLHESPEYLEAVLHTLGKSEKTLSFSDLNPYVDGVAMSFAAEKRLSMEKAFNAAMSIEKSSSNI